MPSSAAPDHLREVDVYKRVLLQLVCGIDCPLSIMESLGGTQTGIEALLKDPQIQHQISSKQLGFSKGMKSIAASAIVWDSLVGLS